MNINAHPHLIVIIIVPNYSLFKIKRKKNNSVNEFNLQIDNVILGN